MAEFFPPRALTYIKKKIFEKTFPTLTYLPGGPNSAGFPISQEMPPGAQFMGFNMSEAVGKAIITSDYADDIPTSDAFLTEGMVRRVTLISCFQYSDDELESEGFSGMPLRATKGTAAREIVEMLMEKIAYYGGKTANGKVSVYGLLNLPNVVTGSVPNGSWTGATTAADMLADLNAILAGQRTATNGMEQGTILGLPATYYALASQKPRLTTDMTVLDFFLKTHPWISAVKPLPLLESANSDGALAVDTAILYTNDVDKASLEIPKLVTVGVPQKLKIMNWVVPVLMQTAGWMAEYPKSIARFDLVP